MYCKVYEAETVLRKNKKRPFAKEVLKEVKNGEDLFTKLYARNIKEIKQKVKCELQTNKKKKKRKIGKMPAFDIIQEQTESVDSGDLLDSFDALLKGSSSQVHVNPVSSSCMTKTYDTFSNNMTKSYVSLRKKGASLLEADKENNVLPATVNENCESDEDSEDMEDKDRLNFKGKKKPSLAKVKPKYMPNLNDSYLSLIEDSFDSDIVLAEFLKRSNRSCNSEKEETHTKNTEGKSTSGTLLRISSTSESNSSDDSLNFDRCQNSKKLCSTHKRRKKSVLKLVSSTPARNTTIEPPCFLSPIFPMLRNQYVKRAQIRDTFGNVVKGQEEDKQLSDSALLHTVAGFEGLNLEENMNIPEAEGQPCANKKSHSSEIGTASGRILHSPDPFAESDIDSQSPTVSDELSNGHCGRVSKVEINSLQSVVPKTNKESFLRNVSCCTTINKELSRRWSTNDFESGCSQHQLSALGRSRIHSEASIGKSPVPRRSHLVVPLSQVAFGSFWRTSGFREVYCGPALCHSEAGEFSKENITIGGRKKDEITFKDVVLEHCGQLEILPFSEAFPNGDLVDCKKIGEGVYGEVFSRQTAEGKSTVMKIMPIEGTCVINGETQKSFEEILPEIVISRELSNLRKDENFCISNFPELVGCWCVQGLFPSRLLTLWREYDEEKTSENDSPEILPEDQIYIILELSNVGSALEGFTFGSAEQSLSAFMQVAHTLGVAEAALEFEHRDLHWGNILIKHTKDETVSCKIYGEDQVLPTHGIQASVIDFTLSRITFDGCCIYNNLAEDPALFEGKGDYQFDIYRMMKDQINDNWQVFQPYNNVLWLSYVLEKLISEVYYHSKTSKAHKRGMSKLRELKEKILDFKSAMDVALSFD